MKLGRPKRTLIDESATQVWFSAVSMASGLATAYQLERHFAAPSSATRETAVGRSCQWDKYQRGSNTPGRKMRDKVESQFPGTRQWLEHPLWDVCSDSPLTNHQLSSAIGLARPKLAKYAGQPASTAEKCYLTYSQSIWSLCKQADLAALVALLAIARDGEKKNHPPQFVDAVHASATTASLLLTRQPFKAALKPLMKYLCEKYFAKIAYGMLPPFASAEEAIHFVELLDLLISEAIKTGLITNSHQNTVALAHWIHDNKHLLRLINRPVSEKSPTVTNQVNLILENYDHKEWQEKFSRRSRSAGYSPYLLQKIRFR